MTAARDSILGRIKANLHNARELNRIGGATELAPPVDMDLLAAQLPESMEDRIDHARQALASLGDLLIECDNWREAKSWIWTERQNRELERGIADPEMAERLWLERGRVTTPADVGWNRDTIFAAEYGVTGGGFFVLETATLVESLTGNSRLISLAPERHYAFVAIDRVFPDMRSLAAAHPAAMQSAVWITGSSRTADIDGILIRGAHGPKSITIILVNEPSTPET